MMNLFGRLKPGVGPEHASVNLGVIAARLARDHPEAYAKNAGFTTTSGLLREELTHGARMTLLVLLAAAGCVLLIAFANVANVTLTVLSF
jgi:hypothetical protein